MLLPAAGNVCPYSCAHGWRGYMYMYVCTAEVLSLAKLYTSFQRVQLKAKIICHRLKIFLVKSHLNSYIIEFPQNSRERSDSRNALIRGPLLKCPQQRNIQRLVFLRELGFCRSQHLKGCNVHKGQLEKEPTLKLIHSYINYCTVWERRKRRGGLKLTVFPTKNPPPSLLYFNTRSR